MKKFLLLLFLCNNLNAQTIEFVVTTGAGGPQDFLARKFAERIEKHSNLELIVVNKPGAAQKIGYNYIEQSNKPTLVISTSEITHFPVYELVESIYDLGTFNNLVFVKSNTVNTIEELSKKSEVKFGHGGEGTFGHKAMIEVCKRMNCLPVPFKSGSDGMLNVLTGTIDAFALVSYGTKQFINSGNYKVIGEVTMDKNWIKLFGKNLTNKQKETIQTVLKQTDKSFYRELDLFK